MPTTFLHILFIQLSCSSANILHACILYTKDPIPWLYLVMHDISGWSKERYWWNRMLTGETCLPAADAWWRCLWYQKGDSFARALEIYNTTGVWYLQGKVCHVLGYISFNFFPTSWRRSLIQCIPLVWHSLHLLCLVLISFFLFCSALFYGIFKMVQLKRKSQAASSHTRNSEANFLEWLTFRSSSRTWSRDLFRPRKKYRYFTYTSRYGVWGPLIDVTGWGWGELLWPRNWDVAAGLREKTPASRNWQHLSLMSIVWSSSKWFKSMIRGMGEDLGEKMQMAIRRDQNCAFHKYLGCIFRVRIYLSR